MWKSSSYAVHLKLTQCCMSLYLSKTGHTDKRNAGHVKWPHGDAVRKIDQQWYSDWHVGNMCKCIYSIYSLPGAKEVVCPLLLTEASHWDLVRKVKALRQLSCPREVWKSAAPITESRQRGWTHGNRCKEQAGGDRLKNGFPQRRKQKRPSLHTEKQDLRCEDNMRRCSVQVETQGGSLIYSYCSRIDR